VTLPTVALGSYFLILRTDYARQINESSEANNDRVIPIELVAPDLTPTELQASTNAAVGQPLQVSWVVKNQGTADAPPSWTDQLYLSRDNVWDVTDTPLVSAERSAVVATGAVYLVTTIATLPVVPVGDYYLVLRVDLNGSLFESSELNNERAAAITLSTADLSALALNAPGLAVSRQTVEISWAVTNQGSGEVSPPWTDRIFLSKDAVWDVTDTEVASSARSLPLAAADAYLAITTFPVPVVPPGAYYLILRADHDQSVVDSRRSNNELAVPIRLVAPDLTATSLAVTKDPLGTRQVEAVWTVRNLGEGDALPNWVDGLYLSADPTWDITDTLLTAATRSLTLASNKTYTAAAVTTVPALPARTYYLILRTDRDNTVFEAEEGNNERSVPISFSNPDLVPVLILAPSAAVPGRQIEITTRAENRAGDALPPWTDRLYLSTDEIFDASDIVLTDVGQSQPLPAGLAYSWTQRITLPNVAAGRYFLIVRSDYANQLLEANETNNEFHQAIQLGTVPTVGAPLRSLDASALGSLAAPAFSTDGIRFAAAAGNQTLLWDLQSGELRRRFAGHSASIDTVQFSPRADQILTGARDGSARIFDADTRKQILSFAATPGQPNPAALSGDGTRVLTGSGLNLPRFWDAVSGVGRTNLFGHTAAVVSLALSPDGTKALTGSDDWTAILWDTITARRLRTFTRHSGSVTVVGFSANGSKALTGSSDGSMVDWDLNTGEAQMALVHGGAVNAAAFSRDGSNIVSSSMSPSVAYLWDTATGSLLRGFQQSVGASPITGAALSPDSSFLVTTHQDGFVRLWPSGLPVIPVQSLVAGAVGRTSLTTLRANTLRYYEFDVEAGHNVVVSVGPSQNTNLVAAESALENVLATSAITTDARFGNLPLAALRRGMHAPSKDSSRFPASSGEFAALRVAASVGKLPSAYDADLFAEAGLATLKTEIPIAVQTSGKLYVLVFSTYLADGQIDLEVNAIYADFHISDVSPRAAGNTGGLTVQLRGTGLTADTLARIIGSDGRTRDASLVQLVDSTRAFYNFDLRGAARGTYDVQIEKPGAPYSRLQEGMQITTGIGPRLEARLIAPSAVRPQRDYNITLEYANVGDADMAAPLFVLRASSPRFYPFAATLYVDFATRFAPVVGQIQLLGLNFDGPPGVLPPGARYHVPLPFRAPAGGSFIRFNLSTLRADDTPIDWDALESSLRPPGIPDDAWAVLWKSFQDSIGDTWADYLRALDSEANLSALSGRPSAEATELLTALFNRVVGAPHRHVLAAATEAQAPGPGVALQFSRLGTDAMEQRFTAGPLGHGWSHNFEYALSSPTNGVLLLATPGGGARRFTLDMDGTWRGEPGDFATLRAVGGNNFALTERDGTVWQFDGSGRLSFIEDPNYNRVSLGYSGGQLVSLAHSAGPAFTLQYDAQGRLSRFTDHANQTTDYQYDATGDHLIRVVSPGGVTNLYAYQAVGGSPADHALTTVTFPDNTHKYFTWDSEGRLAEQFRDNSSERLQFSYTTGGVEATRNANGAITTSRVSDRGQLLQTTDPLGHLAAFEYDTNLDLVRITSPASQVTDFAYDEQGNATQILNPLGQLVALTYTNLSRLDALADARS